MSLIDSTIAFTTAFGLEALLLSSEIRTKLLVGIVLAMMVLLVLWCVGTIVEAKTDFSALDRVHAFKNHLVDFTRKLRGKTSEPEPSAGDGGGDDGQDISEALNRIGSWKETFNRHLRPRRQRASTSATLVNPIGNNGPCGPPGGTGVEMGEMKNGVPTSVV